MLQPGDILQKHYYIESKIGGGGFGTVYRASDANRQGFVAIKELVPDPTATPAELNAARQQFRREATILQNLSHPNIAKVYDSFSENGNEYLVMELIEGRNLDEVAQEALQLGKPLSEGTIRAWIYKVLDALEYIHNHGILHRDIKPANIVLQANGHLVLVDFGLVKLIDPNNLHSYSYVHGVGTPGYAPPEQFMPGMHTSAASDLYSLSATIQNLFTGTPPEPIPPRPLRPGISDNMQSVVEKGKELKQADRFQSATEMRAELLKWKQLSPTLPAPSKIRRPKPNYLFLAATGAIIVMLISLVLYTRGNGGAAQTPTLVSVSLSPTSIILAPVQSSPILVQTTAAPMLTITRTSPSPTRETTQTPTQTYTPTPTQSLTFTPEPSATSTPFPLLGEFASLWNERLGAPKPGYESARGFPQRTFAEQLFKKGHMFAMNQPFKRIWVVIGSQAGPALTTGNWEEHRDDFVDGVSQTVTCNRATGVEQLVGGFRLLWCNNQHVQEVLGVADAPEVDREVKDGYVVYQYQEFERGFIFRDSDGYTRCNEGNCMAYVFFTDDHTFQREPY